MDGARMKKAWKMAAVAALAAAGWCAAASAGGFGVTNIAVKQHWPWNGLVDIDYEVVSEDAGAQYWVYPKATDNRLGRSVKMISLSGDGATNSVGVGTHRMVWDAKADNPGFHTTDLAVTLQAVSGAALYLVVDLSGGTNAVTYPVRYSSEGPDLADDTCRTTELWLRLILPGTFTMGSPTTTLGRNSDENQHAVTLTKPFYLGVFETTQQQYELVTGNALAVTNSAWGPDRARSYVSYNDIRGSSAGAQWPQTDAVDGTSFMGLLRTKTQLHWDLPTESQWEWACRAGTDTDVNTGVNITNQYSDMSMRKAGVITWGQNSSYINRGSYPQRVGQKPPNAWGLYDMHGNVREWCLDWYASYPATTSTDPAGWANGSYRILRGGSWYHYPYECTSARRACWTPSYRGGDYNYNSNPYSDFGFRAAVLPFGE